MDIILFIGAVVGVLAVAAFLIHKFRMRTDSYYRYKFDQALQQDAFQRNVKELQRRMNDPK